MPIIFSHQNQTGALNDICAPLFTRFRLNYFSYGRFYDDGGFQTLTSNPLWAEHFWQQRYPLAKPDINNFANKSSLFCLWDTGFYSQAVHDARNYFDMHYGITLINRKNYYFEYFAFAAPYQHHQAINFYINNLEVLENFSQNFLAKATELIKVSQQNRIMLTNDIDQVYMKIPHGNAAKKPSALINFNQRELACLRLLRKGLTIKEIAQALFLSPRTIEDYINSIKQKLDCKKKSQIISAVDSNFK